MNAQTWMTGLCLIAGSWMSLGCAKESQSNDGLIMAEPGSGLPDLGMALVERFERGQQLFDRPFTPEEGLGPLYNQDRCSSCHDLPVPGGSGTETAILATRFTPPSSCDPLLHEGGSNVQQRTTPLLRERGVLREENPPSATFRGSISPPSLFGLGLIEAVPDSMLELLADPNDANGDGISGRIGRNAQGASARFGRKAEFSTIRSFVEGALRFELGLTTPEHPQEETLNGTALPEGVDPAPDPEMSADDIDLITDFIRFLAPSEPAQPATQVERETWARGETLFAQVGCTDCHIPTLQSGNSEIPALSEKTFPLYSDLLLHDLGPGFSSICGAGAQPTEFRTARLTGLRFRSSYLHDDSAGSIWGAIVAHGGEAAAAQAGFSELNRADQEALVGFISSR